MARDLDLFSFVFLFGLLLCWSPEPIQSKPTDLITGQPATPGQFPFLAYISWRTLRDTAVLISERHLLTKARNFENWDTIEVLLGAQYVHRIESHQQESFVFQRGIIYKEPIRVGFDLAILIMAEPIVFTDYVRPALLPRWSDQGRDYAGQQSRVVAWYHGVNGTSAGFQDVEIKSPDGCGLPRIAQELCVGESVTNSGDNGAPLVVETDDGYEVVGVFSYSSNFSPEGETIRTNVFIKLSEQLEFIAEITNVTIRP